MTAIVAVRKGNKAVIASDSLTTFGSVHVSQSNYSSVKIRKIGSSYVAMSGYTIYKNILDEYLKDRKGIKLNTEKEIYRFILKFWKELKEHYAYVNNQSGRKSQPFADLNSMFLILNQNGIFTISGICQLPDSSSTMRSGRGLSIVWVRCTRCTTQSCQPGQLPNERFMPASLSIHGAEAKFALKNSKGKLHQRPAEYYQHNITVAKIPAQ